MTTIMRANKTTSKITPNEMAYNNFIDSIKSPKTKSDYIKNFGYFLKFVNKTYENLDELLQEDTKDLQQVIIDYIRYMRDRQHSSSYVAANISPIKKFFSMNDILLNWIKINSFKGEYTSVVEDTPYTKEQIKLMLEKSNQRDRAIILLMSSAGLRVGAIPPLKIGDLTSINTKYGDLYMITPYRKSSSKYFTFCTPECRKEIDGYLEFRKLQGETITNNSPLFRQEFNSFDINEPKPLSDNAICFMIRTLLVHKTGIRKLNELTSYRHSQMMNHAFRKYFAHQISQEAHVDSVWCEMLLGHTTGLKEVYNKPKFMDVLNGNDRMFGYVSAINNLTINQEENLKAEVEVLRNKDKEMEAMRQQMQLMKQTQEELQVLLRNPKKLSELLSR